MKAVYFDTKTATVNEEFRSVGQARAILRKKNLAFVDVMDYGEIIRVLYDDDSVWDENIDVDNIQAHFQAHFHATVINEDRKVEYMRVPVLYNAPVTCRKWNYYQKADGTVVGRSYNQAFSNGIWYHPDGFESPGYRLKNPESHLGY